MNTTDRRLYGQERLYQRPYFKVAILFLFALVSYFGGRWLHTLGHTQHAHLYMPPFIIAGEVTDMGKVFHYAGSLTWITGAIYLVKTVIVWLAENLTPTV